MPAVDSVEEWSHNKYCNDATKEAGMLCALATATSMGRKSGICLENRFARETDQESLPVSKPWHGSSKAWLRQRIVGDDQDSKARAITVTGKHAPRMVYSLTDLSQKECMVR